MDEIEKRQRAIKSLASIKRLEKTVRLLPLPEKDKEKVYEIAMRMFSWGFQQSEAIRDGEENPKLLEQAKYCSKRLHGIILYFEKELGPQDLPKPIREKIERHAYS